MDYYENPLNTSSSNNDEAETSHEPPEGPYEHRFHVEELRLRANRFHMLPSAHNYLGEKWRDIHHENAGRRAVTKETVVWNIKKLELNFGEIISQRTYLSFAKTLGPMLQEMTIVCEGDRESSDYCSDGYGNFENCFPVLEKIVLCSPHSREHLDFLKFMPQLKETTIDVSNGSSKFQAEWNRGEFLSDLKFHGRLSNYYVHFEIWNLLKNLQTLSIKTTEGIPIIWFRVNLDTKLLQ